MLVRTLLVLLCAVPLLGQELSLRSYLRRLDRAPGSTIERKVEYLSNIGVTLSDQGLRDLDRTTTTPTLSNRGQTSNRIGGFTYHNSDNGISGTSQQMGNFTYHNLSNGVSGTTQQIGKQQNHNFNNGLSGTSNRIGNFNFHNFNNGVSGTSTKIGGFTFHNLSDGTNCTSNQIGSFTYTNCNK